MSTPPLPPKETLQHNGVRQDPQQQRQQQQPQQQRQQVEIRLPESIRELPTNELSKLLDSVNILKGYLITLADSQIQDGKNELDSCVAHLQVLVDKLVTLEQQREKTNLALDAHVQLNNRWESVQLEMYSELKKFTPESIHMLLLTAVEQSRKLTESLAASFINHIGEHDNASVQSFIQSYRLERKSYHLRNEKLHRFDEERIGGW